MWIEQGSNWAPLVDFDMNMIHLATIIPFVLLNAVLVYFIIKYRRRGENDQTSSIAHSTVLEVAWTVIPTIVLFALFIMGLVTFRKMRTVAQGAREIEVVGQKWQWDFYYPSLVRENKDKGRLKLPTGQLYLEEGVPVKFLIRGTDVIHSFFVPAFRIKEDAVPNMYTFSTVTPVISEEQKKSGKAVYRIFCTEYCGTQHSGMLGDVHVLPTAEFQKRIRELEEAENNVSPDEGKKIVQQSCKACHSIDGSKVVGPSLKGLFGKKEALTTGEEVTVDENYLIESMLQPGAKIVKGFPNAMPPQNLTDAELASVIAYIKTLK